MPENLASSTKHSQISLCNTKVSIVVAARIVRGKTYRTGCYRRKATLICDWKVCQTMLFQWCGKFTFVVIVLKSAQDRKIALIVNNCPAHAIVDGQKAVELIFLPPNTPSKTRPVDQGVIKSLKAIYRHSFIKRYITSIDGGRSPAKVNLLETMTLITAA